MREHSSDNGIEVSFTDDRVRGSQFFLHSTAEVNQVIEDALNSDAFDAALAANLASYNCTELEGVTLASVAL